MKKLNFLTALMIILSMYFFVSCEDEESDLPWSDRFARADIFINGCEDDSCILLTENTIYVRYENHDIDSDDKRGCKVYMGKNKQDLKFIYDFDYKGGEISKMVEYYNQYYVKVIQYGLSNNQDTIWDTPGYYILYFIPNIKYDITTGEGHGETASWIKWHPKYSDENIKIPIPNLKNNKISITAEDENLEYRTDPIYVSEGVDSIYISQGGTLEKPDYPSYIYIPFDNGKGVKDLKIRRYFFEISGEITVGDSTFTITSPRKEIYFYDGEKYAIDTFNNLYRIENFGSKSNYWTIDPIKCRLSDVSEIVTSHNFYFRMFDYYTCYELKYFDGSFNGNFYPKGYNYLDVLSLRNLLEILFGENPQNIYHKFTLTAESIRNGNFLKELEENIIYKGSWSVFASQFGWIDENGIEKENNVGNFNIYPYGIGVANSDDLKDCSVYYEGQIAAIYINPGLYYGQIAKSVLIISEKFDGIAVAEIDDNIGVNVLYKRD